MTEEDRGAALASLSMTRRLVIPGISALAMLGVLLFLGTWQISRRAWKQEVLAAIAAAEQRPLVPLPATPPVLARVRAEGQFAPGIALYGAEVRSVAGVPTGGARLLGILLREGAPPVLVDRGWIPVPTPNIAAGPATIDGYIRLPDQPGTFTPADDLPGRRFYTLAPATIGRALGFADLAPFVLVALGPPPAAGYPEPAASMPRPANNHLTYALTWYGLAGILVVIFAVYLRATLVRRVPRS